MSTVYAFFLCWPRRQAGLTGNCIAAAAESEQGQVTQAARALTTMSLYGVNK